MNRRRFLQSGSLAAMGALAWRSDATAAAATPPARSDSARAHLTAVATESLGIISRNIYGQFTEHVGSCIYDAMWLGVAHDQSDDQSIQSHHFAFPVHLLLACEAVNGNVAMTKTVPRWSSA